MTSDVLRQRAEIEESIRGRTVCDQLRETAEQFPDDPALSQASPGGSDPDGWASHPVVLPEGWMAIEADRVFVRGQAMRLIARHGELTILEPL